MSGIATGLFVTDLAHSADLSVRQQGPVLMLSRRFTDLAWIVRVCCFLGQAVTFDHAVAFSDGKHAIEFCAAIGGAEQTVIALPAKISASVIPAFLAVAFGLALSGET